MKTCVIARFDSLWRKEFQELERPNDKTNDIKTIANTYTSQLSHILIESMY